MLLPGTKADARPSAAAEHLLRPFQSHVVNVHLVVVLLDLVVGHLFPELVARRDDTVPS